MKALLVLLTISSTSLVWAQPAGGSAQAPAEKKDPVGEPPKTGNPADPLAGEVPLPKAPPPAPSIDLGEAQATCDGALANPPGGDKRFVNDVQYGARGWLASEELTKTKEGRACMAAIANVDTARSKYSGAADARDAAERVDATHQQHERAAAAIAKNEKHVVYAYAALWILSAAFLLFMWRRQQTLKGEIAQLKRDLDSAAKE